ncbi:MAG: LamG domain-containing protein [Planctomycetes bacterium]|nr:LamG domain-containing protein [Planctomycetota bacterium]
MTNQWRIGLVLLAVVCFCGPSLAQDEKPQLCEPWETEYKGDDATGKHVIALWQFNPGSEAKDNSGHGHDLKPAGAKFSKEGKFGGALESFCGWPVGDKKHAATAANSPGLTPKGAFTIEFWMKPKPEFKDYPDCFFIDKKYVDHTDYQIILGGAGRRSESRAWRAILGFGGDSQTYYSEKRSYEPGKWYHIAFTYDGAGTGAFYVNGIPIGKTTYPGRKNIVPGKKPLSIGDRIGSYYHGFPGYIDQVRISNGVREFCPARFAFVSERTSFRRMEKGQVLRFTLTNLLRVPLKGAVARVSMSGYCEKTFNLPELAAGETKHIDYPLDTSLRPDTYQVKASITIPRDRGHDAGPPKSNAAPKATPAVKGKAAPKAPIVSPEAYVGEESFPVTIVARRTPNTMPVVMWGGHGNSIETVKRMKDIGFTHCLGLSCDFKKIWDAGKPIDECARPDYVARAKEMLNLCLAENFGVIAGLSPGSWLRRTQDKMRRIDRKGKPYGGKDKDKGDVCGQFPEARKFCYNVGASVAQTYGKFPAFEASMVHTEVRGHTRPCFHQRDKDAFKKFAGYDIPEEVTSSSRGVKYEKLKDFPADRIIPDDNPILTYYKWFWKTGDGWNPMHTALHKGLKSTGRKDLWTYHDPAVRVPSIWGNGGAVDILSQWTYSYPDPIRIACATDELFAMAKGGPPYQKVMKMTQIIWYRSQTAPKSKASQEAVQRQTVWEDTDPDADFITIAPMHLREAFWTKISRPIRGIMYHGWGSLVHTEKPGGYRYTNPQTKYELARLIRTVVRPLGPTLLQVPGVKADVAFLESFASQMFAGRGTYGWNGRWEGNAYHIVQYAQLQPEIVYDETVLRDGLDRFKVLFMMGCDVLTESVAKRAKEFQAKGGLIVGDENLAPAIQPDILIQSYDRTRKAKEDKAALLARAAALRKDLDPHYTRYVESSNPQVITYRRRYGDTDYVFAINDNREYGDYVGRHGLVMENGLPSDTVITVNRAGGVVYDLVNHKPVAAEVKDGKLTISAHLGPCKGRLLMVTPSAIESVRVKCPESIARGTSGTITIEVLDANGRPVDAVCPIQMDILDAEGRPAEFSGYYGAAGGKATIQLDIAPNDRQGIWTIAATDLASGRTSVRYLRVTGAR